MEGHFPGCAVGKLGQILLGWLVTTLNPKSYSSGTSVQGLHFHLLAVPTKTTVLSSHCRDTSGSHVLGCL